ncbi:hypothetical protein [Streptomyces sp. NPDC056308]|uniref:hypothetical protein n=1 Tax=Streptomyces sp. NPDC056308 TaxID=3345780 RepID=UPI0035E15F79
MTKAAERDDATRVPSRDEALRAVRRYITTYCRSGEQLPTLGDLHEELSYSKALIRGALTRLDTAGLIVWCRAWTATRVLKPGEIHPADVGLDRSVRERISSGYYQPGQALPTGLLADEHDLSVEEVPRACRHLVRDGLLHHDDHGPFGPGLYVSAGI